jgi:hypothetical protein
LYLAKGKGEPSYNPRRESRKALATSLRGGMGGLTVKKTGVLEH